MADFDELMQFQNLLQKKIKKEDKLSKKIELLSLINQMTMGPKNIVQKELLIIEAAPRGFSENDIDEILKELIKESILYESSPGFIQKVR